MNYPENLPGRGWQIIETAGKKVLFAQVLGRLFMPPVNSITEPLDNLLKLYTLGKNIDAILIDIHGEATSEKIALGYYLDGRVSLVAGTHTHVPTADARILPQKTGYITDVGMCGDYNSVIGFDKTEPLNRLLRKYTGGRLTPAKGPGTLFGVLIDIDDKSGKATHIEQIKMSEKEA